MSFSKKLTSVLLSLCMVVSVLSVAIVPAAAETTYETYAQETVRGSNILHCFNWSYNQIKSNLADIAKAGYTAVQTSPVQSPKDYNSSWTDTPNQWWKMYQPLGFSVSNSSWLGTKAELTSLCTEAEKYNIKVVVDIVANHLANNGTDGGTYSYINSGVESNLKNANYYHTNNTRTNDNSRYNITQYHLGMPDLNTGNSYVQQRALGLLEECIDCGVDGFRFDAAKHIEVPNDPSSCRSNFWPTVINGAKDYAEQNGKEAPFYYGEILGGAGTDISNYTQYMAVTDNYTGDLALDKAYYNAASELASSTYHKGASASNSVLWAESHDTYMGNSGSVIGNGLQNTSGVDSTVINKAWAIVGARADSTALFFARPNSTMGYASTDGNWKSKAVSEVNKFKSHFDGTNEYLASSGNTAYIERCTKGVVISKLDGGGQVSLTAHQMEDGTYTDYVTGDTFTVSNGVISGNVDSQGVAVVYNADQSAGNYIEADTLYLDPGISSWKQSNQRYAMYVFNNSSSQWVSMTDSNSDGVYEAAVPSGNWTGVIFCTMNASNQTNSWDIKTNQTVDLFPTDDNDLFTVTGADSGDGSKFNGTWSVYSPQAETTAPTTQPTTEPETQPSTEPSSDTYTVYAYNAPKWNTMKVYYWGSSGSNPDWPGNDMTQGGTVYTAEIPKDATGVIFNNGNSGNGNQTVNITGDMIHDNAQYYINPSYNSNCSVEEAPTYYLVGTMSSWQHNDDYAFTLSPDSSGAVQYKLSDVSLAAGDELKVNDTKNHWYPNGTDNNYTVSASCTYDIYFRPNADGGTGWHKGYIYAAIKHDWDMDDNAVDWTWDPSSGDDPGINSINAVMTAHCKNCDATETANGVVESNGYDEPGCTEAGTRHYIATAEFNGKTFSSTHDYTIPSPYGSHDLSHHSATAPTASANGTTEYWKCDRCGKYFSDANAQTEITEKQTLVPYFTYSKDGNDVLVSGYYGSDTAIVIPDTVPDYYPDETLRGEAITKIPRGPFTDNTRITSVSMGDNITEIGWQAFMNCSAIKEVHIGSGIQLISSGSFLYCDSLESFYCTKVDDTSVYDTLFTMYTFNSEGCITFYGSHSGKFYDEAHMDFINNRGVSNFKYIGTDAHTDTGTFNWDGYTCTEATVGCSKCDYKETVSGVTVSSVVTTEPTYEADGLRTYTASVTYNGTEYTDTKTEVIPYEDIITNLVGHSISLDGSIGVNFYMELSDDVIADKDTAYMHFTIPGNGEPGTQDVYVKDAETRTVGDKTYYIFTCDVAAKEIESNITAQLFNGDQVSRIYTYSVKQYADYLIAHQDESATFKKAVPLVEAMLVYGENARYYFDKTDEKPADLDVTIPEFARTVYELPEGVTYGGVTLSLKSETTLSIYFNSETEPTLTCYDEGVTYEIENTDKHEYVIRIRGIAAYDLDKQFTVYVNGQKAVEYSPLRYCFSAQNSSDTRLANTVKALYLYWQAAQDYFGDPENGGGN